MHNINRRKLITGLLAGGPAIAVGAALPFVGASSQTRRIIVVGGGPAGVAAVLAARRADSRVRLILVERDPGRLKPQLKDRHEFLRPSLDGAMELLGRADVDVALDDIEAIDWASKTAHALSGRAFVFDEIVLAPGTAVQDEGISGLDAQARHRWPAAWGSRREARRLAAQLAGMPEDGHVVVRLPAGEVSHQQGLAHRAIRIAQYLNARKTAARLTVLDATDGLEAADVFASAAARGGFGGRVRWIGGEERARVLAVDAAAGTIETPAGTLKADVVNFITPQQAGPIAHASGLVDQSGWCPCGADQRSLINPAAFVVGDANRFARRSIDGAMQSGAKAAQFFT
ncbi:MAG: FAD-dependent oxidoreductase [Pseudomonadota bacterium]